MSAEPNTVRWVECPRDAWQSLPVLIPTEVKRDHLRALVAAGFRNLDLGSFVSERAVPQMADTEEVLAGLERPPQVDFLAIIGNMRGLERAASAPDVTSIGYPLSVNETFQVRNTGRDLETSWRLVADLKREAEAARIELVVYLSMGFGNPYGEQWRPQETADAVSRLRDLGIGRVAIADTVGTAHAPLVESVLTATESVAELGLHLHARPERWQELVECAWEAGIRWFEGALAGAGGCPFAGDELVGNLPSELVLPWLAERAELPGLQLERLPTLAARAAEITELGRPAGHG